MWARRHANIRARHPRHRVVARAITLRADAFDFDDGTIVEMVIWKVPKPIEGSLHAYKYRLFFGRAGERIVGCDNERLKGDHCHVEGREQPYKFKDVETLVHDFLLDIERWRSK